MTNTKYRLSEDAASLDQATPDITDSAGSDRLIVTIMMTMAALIGIWSLLCLVAGMLNMGGVLELGRSWLSAVTG